MREATENETTSTQRPRRPRRRRAALAALAVGACLAAAPAVASAAAGPVVLAQVAGGEDGAEAVAARTGLPLTAAIPEIGWAVYGTAGNPATAHRSLLADPSVARLDWGLPGESLDLDFTPRDTIFNQPGTVTLDGQLVAPWNWHWLKTNFPAAWDVTRGSAAVRVAVIDSEFDTEHAELKTKLATGKNFDSGTTKYRTSDVRAEDINTGFHGSHVAGLVGAATDNGNGVVGACFDCVVIPYKIGFGGAPNVDAKFVADLTEALVEAGNSDAVVINMSLGTSRDHAPLRAAVDFARSRGKVVVASAGNSQLGGQGPSGVPNYPAAYPGVIAVASTRPDDSISPDSTNGDYVDVAAPGNPILSTWDSRLTTALAPNLAPTHGVGYKVLSGTSMASPIVAGLVALMKTVRPDLNPDEVEGLLKQSSVDLGAAGPDPVFGAGRIDALRAVQAARDYQRPAAPPTPLAAPLKRVKFIWSCKAGRTKVTAGKRVYARFTVKTKLVCKGRTAPALRKTRVDVQRFVAKRGWRKVGSFRTNSRGRFGFTRKLSTLGGWTLRPSYAGSATLRASSGKGVKVRAVTRRR